MVEVGRWGSIREDDGENETERNDVVDRLSRCWQGRMEGDIGEDEE
jgi:hypothetical protein